MAKHGDYTRSSFKITMLVILLLACVAFIPPFSIGSVRFRRANIFSDLYSFGDRAAGAGDVLSLPDAEFLEDYTPPVAVAAPAADTVARFYTVPVIEDGAIVRIEDFSDGRQMTARFYHDLAYESGSRTVRIAVLGDSFIEADIITADMRERLQDAFGGRGIGFVPLSTPLSKYRGTVRHTHQGWTEYNLLKRRSVPERYRDMFYVSGILSVPSEGAVTSYRGTEFRRHLTAADRASLFFSCTDSVRLDVTVNDSIAVHCDLAPREGVQRVDIEPGEVASLGITVHGAAGTVGYGAVIEDTTGVSVHNYSVRSNSGLALLGTSHDVNRAMDGFMEYDMVILQYGLNAMSPDVTDYSRYRGQLVKIIEYVRGCFPSSAIVVMSVGDRSTMQNGEAVTMPAVKAMLAAQEGAARDCGVAFWNTYEAMGGENSMPGFVARKWAAKDYTHIGYPGGRYIAGRFADAVVAAVESVREQDSLRAARSQIRMIAPSIMIMTEIGPETVADERASILTEYGMLPGSGDMPLSGTDSAAEENGAWSRPVEDLPADAVPAAGSEDAVRDRLREGVETPRGADADRRDDRAEHEAPEAAREEEAVRKDGAADPAFPPMPATDAVMASTDSLRRSAAPEPSPEVDKPAYPAENAATQLRPEQPSAGESVPDDVEQEAVGSVRFGGATGK